jgi:ABC-type uncharacterized transport system involved in gliding motility auxiliary subunit
MDKTIEKQKVLIKDVPYFYINESIFNGTIEEVAKNILDLKNKLKEAYLKREKDKITTFRKDMIPTFTPFEDYKYIHFDVEKDYDGYIEYKLKVFRDETDEELNKRIEANKNKSIAAKKAAKSKKLAQEKRERTLFESLKKKYEKNI